MVTPAAKKAAAQHLQAQRGLSQRRAARLMSVPTCSLRYQSRRREDTALLARLKELAQARPRYGYRCLAWLLRREGWAVNFKRVLRLYREEGLKLRAKKRKRIASSQRVRPEPTTTGQRVVRVLQRLAETRGLPHTIQVDNGPEFTGRALDEWAFRNRVKLHFIEPAKPVQNAIIESFNGQEWFTDLHDARQTIESWRLDNLAPAVWLQQQNQAMERLCCMNSHEYGRGVNLEV